MDTSDVTIEILKGIRDEIRQTREGLREEIRLTRDGLGTRIDVTNERLGALEQRQDRAERRQVESEIRLSTEIVALVGVVREVRDAIRDDRVSRVKVDDHERRITALEKPGRRST